MKKKNFEPVKIDILYFTTMDVITTSGGKAESEEDADVVLGWDSAWN